MALAVGATAIALPRAPFSTEEIDVLQALSLDSLPPLPPDATNQWADDPAAAAFGGRLFADARFSSNGSVSCATCHRTALSFTDGLSLARGVGEVPRKTMTIVGTAYSQWLFWDGRKDSQWAQALGPLESLVEHGGTRTQYAHLVAEHYADEYESVFGPLPDLSDRSRFPMKAGPHGDEEARAAWERMRPADQDAVTAVFVNVGKAIAAFERLIVPSASRFDRYVSALVAGDPAGGGELSDDEIAGLRLFIGEARCVTCHNGPLFTNGDFHNTGVPQEVDATPDTGRAAGAIAVLSDEFSCASRWSDGDPEKCDHLEFLRVDDHRLEGAFKVPTLRNVDLSAPYMDAGQFATLAEVVRHYNDAPEATVGHSELKPMGLTEDQLYQLELFLRTLSGPAEMPDFPPRTED
jgi:cytochrome c peroxidase